MFPLRGIEEGEGMKQKVSRVHVIFFSLLLYIKLFSFSWQEVLSWFFFYFKKIPVLVLRTMLFFLLNKKIFF